MDKGQIEAATRQATGSVKQAAGKAVGGARRGARGALKT